ncbi:2-oxoacid ferredoxin oxidoreductase [compost metagenome]
MQIAALPTQIRGFGHVKEANVEKVKVLEAQLLAEFHNPSASQPVIFIPVRQLVEERS